MLGPVGVIQSNTLVKTFSRIVLKRMCFYFVVSGGFHVEAMCFYIDAQGFMSSGE